MTTTGRTVVAVVALLSGVALAIVGVIVNDSGAIALGSSLATGPVTYAFGDRNGEKRTAAALAERGLDARALDAITTAITNPAPPV